MLSCWSNSCLLTKDCTSGVGIFDFATVIIVPRRLKFEILPHPRISFSTAHKSEIHSYLTLTCTVLMSFIHSFVDSDTNVDNYEFSSLSILCSYFHLITCPFTYILHPYSYWTAHFIFLSTLSSSICKCDKSLEPLNAYPAYSIFLFIMSFVKCNSVCNSIFARFMTFSVDTLSLQLIPSIIL